MDRQIIAIGGGGFGRNPGEGIIESYILEKANARKPNICFIPTATGDDDAYKVNYYSTFTKLNCNPVHIDFFKRTPNIKNIIENQDVVFVGGGNTKSMLAVWRDWGLDSILEDAYRNGVVMSGVSAGAICWFSEGITDSWESDLFLLPCLGFLEGCCCPHYDEEKNRKPALAKMLRKSLLEQCFCIEGGSALHFKNENVFSNVPFLRDKKSYVTRLDKGNVIEEPIQSIEIERQK